MSEVTNHGISIGLIFLQLHVILIAIPHRITILCISICFLAVCPTKEGQLILYKHVVNNIFHVPKVLASLDVFSSFAKYLSIFLYCFLFLLLPLLVSMFSTISFMRYGRLHGEGKISFYFVFSFQF